MCGYCQSTVVRDGPTLARLGKMAEVFDDFSPLQLQTSGVYQGHSFTLVGRLQYQYPHGTWTEWHAVLDDGSTALLCEDNGAYVIATATEFGRAVPEASTWWLGLTTAFNGTSFSVASNEQVSLRSAQGELPHLPPLGLPFAMVELRSADGLVLSIDYSPTVASSNQPPVLALGRSVLLEELQLTGLRQDLDKTEKGRQFDCPQCGAAVQVQLASSKSISCRACNSLIDVSQGMGVELKHAEQSQPVQPLIALGSVGQFQGVAWQVVGFQVRTGRELAARWQNSESDGSESDGDESFTWREYLLYNQKRGFVFLVDTSEGWSLVKPATGAPKYKEGVETVNYLGANYRLLSAYEATTQYVAGEFYWQVVRGQTTTNRDYANGRALLSQERSANEVTWSSGNIVEDAVVAKALGMEAQQALFKRTGTQLLGRSSGANIRTVVIVVLVVFFLIVLTSRCSRCNPQTENCSNYNRTSSGSYGGFSGGGGHK